MNRFIFNFIAIILTGSTFFASLHSLAANTNLVQEGYFVSNRSFQKQISQIPGLTIDHVSNRGFEVWGPRGLGQWLQRNSIPSAQLRGVHLKGASDYPSPEEISRELAGIAQTNPQLTKLFSIGKSVKGRDLLVMKIAANVTRNDNRPEFKFIANMHGDEIVGRELMVLLIKDLVSNYGKDPFITKLLDTTQIYIMPSMNPDGAAAGTRGNANSVDLNRNFPDFSTSDNQDRPDGRAVETQAVMNWQATRKFVLSANFHGGAEVVNYLWDTSGTKHPKVQWLQALALNYAKLAPYIFASTTFKNGITNGYDWYEVNGGMQDWSTYYRNDIQFTIELSDEKWPNYSTVEYYYKQNRNALLYLMSQTQTVAQFFR
ncbi:MAG: M14 family zinc carboxypeptidase [Bdellovibrionota bacterium]